MELHDSGFPGAIHELTKEMVDCTQIKALLSKTDTITKHLKVLRSVQGCGPLSYSSPSFHLLLADENFLRQGEPRTEKVLIMIDTLIHAKSMYITYGIYLSYIPQTETNY